MPRYTRMKVTPALPEFIHPESDINQLVSLIEKQIELYHLPAESPARPDNDTILDYLEYYLTAYAQGIRDGIIKNSKRLPFKISPSSLDEFRKIPFSVATQRRILGLEQEDAQAVHNKFRIYFYVSSINELKIIGNVLPDITTYLHHICLVNISILNLIIETSISREIAEAIRLLLLKNTTISQLDISQANYDNGFLAELIGALAQNITLTNIKFNSSNTDVNKDLVGAINRLIQRNQRLSNYIRTIDSAIHFSSSLVVGIHVFINGTIIPHLNTMTHQEDWNALRASPYFKTLVDSATSTTKARLENFSPANLQAATAPLFVPTHQASKPC